MAKFYLCQKPKGLTNRSKKSILIRPCSRGISGPLYLKSAIAGVMSGLGLVPVWLPFISGVEVWVLRNGCLRTVSGWEQSSTKQNFPCAVRVPGGVNCKGNAYGFMFEAGRTVFEFYKDGFSGFNKRIASGHFILVE